MKYVIEGSVNYYFLIVLENVFISAVNLFVLISGYFLIDTKKRSLSKIFGLLVQTIIIQIFGLFINILMGTKEITQLEVIRSFLPINYYVVLYATLYIISPYINVMISSLSQKKLFHCVAIMFSIFSVYAFSIDIIQGKLFAEALSPIGISGSQGGYTIINFMLMYLIGAAIKKCNIELSNLKLRLYLFACFTILIAMSLLSWITWNYNNPLVILEAIFFFMIFKNMHMKSVLINQLSKASFVCFLLHPYLIDKVCIDFFVHKNILILMFHIIFVIVVIYLISFIVYLLYQNTVAKVLARANGFFEKIDVFLYGNL